jgi:hypothetical protein
MTDEYFPEYANPHPVTEALDQELERFKQRFRKLMAELAEKEYPMSDNDLVLFRESLLELPASEHAADSLGAVRQEALDDPLKLRELYQATQRTREAVERMSQEAGYSRET